METVFIGHSAGLDRVDVDGTANVEHVLESAPVAQVAVDPNDPGRVYVATLGDGVFRSNDFGGTFAHCAEVRESQCWSVAVGGAGEVYVGTEGAALLRSTDGGDTFEELASASHRSKRVRKILVDEVVPDTIVVGIERSDDVYSDTTTYHLTSDAGRTWEAYFEGLPPEMAAWYGLGASAPRSLPDGTWRDPFRGNAVISERPAPPTLAAAPSGVVYYVNEPGEIFRSPDGAETFTKVEYADAPISGAASAVFVAAA